MKKPDKEPEKKIEKKWFDVKIEAMVPATLVYKIWAETPQEALLLIKNKTPNAVSYKLMRRKELKAIIYDMGCSMIRLVKMITK